MSYANGDKYDGDWDEDVRQGYGMNSVILQGDLYITMVMLMKDIGEMI